MITFSQGGAAKIKPKQFSEFGSRTKYGDGMESDTLFTWRFYGMVNMDALYKLCAEYGRMYIKCEDVHKI